MKRFRFFSACLVALCCLAGVALSSCSESDEGIEGGIVLTGGSQPQQSFSSDELSGTLSFTATAAWSASIVETTGRSEQMPAPDWISLDRYSGGAGEQTLTITLKPNDTGSDRSADIVIASGDEELRISVTQSATTGDGGDDGEPVVDTDEYDWVEYETLYIMDDGEDHHLPGDQYIWFEEPGFFRSGWSDGEYSELLDVGAMSWKDFSIMDKPEYPDNTADWTEELIPCVKGHGYFAGWRSTGYSTRIVRFWVEDYIMQGDEVVGAKLRVTRAEFPSLYQIRNYGNLYRIGWGGSIIQFQSPRSVLGKRYGRSADSVQNTYVMDGGAMEFDDWADIMENEQDQDKPSQVPAFNTTDWVFDTPVLCEKGHGYYARIVDIDNGTGVMDPNISEGFYVRDYIVENGQIVGLIIQTIEELEDVTDEY